MELGVVGLFSSCCCTCVHPPVRHFQTAYCAFVVRARGHRVVLATPSRELWSYNNGAQVSVLGTDSQPQKMKGHRFLTEKKSYGFRLVTVLLATKAE